MHKARSIAMYLKFFFNFYIFNKFGRVGGLLFLFCFSLMNLNIFSPWVLSLYKPVLREWIGYRNHLIKKAQWFGCHTMASMFKTEFEGHSNENNSDSKELRDHFLDVGTSYSL